MFKPVSLHEGYCLAKLHEATLASITKRSKPIFDRLPVSARNSSYRETVGGTGVATYQKPFLRSNMTGNTSGPRSLGSSIGFVTSKPRKVLTSKEINEKRANSMCFFYDEKYYPSHKCKGQVYRLEVIEEEEEVEVQEDLLEDSTPHLLHGEE